MVVGYFVLTAKNSQPKVVLFPDSIDEYQLTRSSTSDTECFFLEEDKDMLDSGLEGEICFQKTEFEYRDYSSNVVSGEVKSVTKGDDLLKKYWIYNNSSEVIDGKFLFRTKPYRHGLSWFTNTEGIDTVPLNGEVLMISVRSRPIIQKRQLEIMLSHNGCLISILQNSIKILKTT